MKLPDEARDIIKILEKFSYQERMATLTTLLMVNFFEQGVSLPQVKVIMNGAFDEFGKVLQQHK